jgi:hypothetical protein
MFSKLNASDKRFAVLGAIVAIAGILSFADPSGNWGSIVALGLLGGVGAVLVVLWPQLQPNTKLMVPKGTALLVCGIVAAAAFGLAALTWFSYVIAVTRVFSIIFDVGLVAAIALAYFGWMAYAAEKGTTPMAAAAPAAPAATEPPAPPAA